MAGLRHSSLSSSRGADQRTSAIRFLHTSKLPLVILLIASAWQQVSAQAPSAALVTPNAQDVIAYLNQNIDWYRHLASEESIATDPGDVLFVNDNRETANQIVRLSFEFARAAAQVASTQSAPQTNPSPASSRFQNLVQIAVQTDQVVRQTQTEIDQVRNQAQTARPAARQKLQATVEELQSELALAQARSEAVHNIIQFANTGSTGASGGNLLAQVQQLQRSVPEVTVSSPSATSPDGQTKSGTASTSTGNAASTNTRREQPTGLLALITDLLSLTRKIHVIDDTLRSTDALADTSQSLRTPLSKNISPLVQRGNVLAQQADTSDVAGLEQQKRELDALTAQFKQNSSMVLPLSKQAVLLDLFKSNLSRWRDAVKTQYQLDLRNLGIRLLVLTLVVGTFFILGEIWKRATFRYVHDFRRRYQFLLLRRILLWFVIAVTIAFALATEIGSLATFAGLITAGIAVALQNVILAVAGYFFLIGRYGVKIGDRVQISGVTGDVIDIGLVRIHLMEMGGSGNYIQPTGRVVVFSNSIVFQPTASFYKQIPGTNFVWHEVSLTLAPQSDTAVAESRLLGAVEKIFATYKDRIEQEHKHMQSLLNVRGATPKPTSRLRLTQTGLEVIIRYPVELDNAAEIDDRITRELLAALEREPRLRLVGSGTPNIQPVPLTNSVEADGASSATDVKK
jgi:small-conductance mechanosensitive channel